MKKLTGSELTIEFPLHRENRESLGFPDKEFSLRGHLMLHGPSDSRNKEFSIRDSFKGDTENLSSGTLYGGAVLHTVFRHMMRRYCNELLPQLWSSVHRSLHQVLPIQELDLLLTELLKSYPNNRIFHGQLRPELILQDAEKGDFWRQLVLEQILLLRLAQENPALKPVVQLISPKNWEENPLFRKAADRIELDLENLPVFGPEQKVLHKLLRTPIEYSSNLQEQLRYIRDNWGEWLGDLLPPLLESLDVLAEENQIRLPGPGPAQGVDFSFLEEDFARYSPDSSWMPRVILMAKNALVWLYQLSKKYNRDIRYLSEIPNEELDFLRDCGFTGLWLIGLWERSPASQEIKKRCGNPEAEASAYSLFDYNIADKLGGEEAIHNLGQRCLERGIRLASDMVPNHTGIDSEWVRNHPEWFIKRGDCPFPQYQYNGENLSSDPNLEIYLEDHYYDKTDCAVTFKRVDRTTGETQYIYHGNDGTSMPWNDTAQIDFLNPQAREAVIEEILKVARNFPIIRFDAAMVLARKHIRRLWYPKPGEGGAIPSRSDSALSDKSFYEAIPEEFWRDVVQRVSQECPETLLLAEAFWMMEGFFVRNLGMHRVYNSAFMNMMKDEKNREFKDEIKKTLNYDPEILKRYVNFMSNPDEDTAETQFGKHDKYFGVFAMMLTLPGLPMIGHGQLEGYTEKYGMEYSRSYYDETPDQQLLERHRLEIYPIMKQRQLFSDASLFHLFDAYGNDGNINDNVFAYSNVYRQNFSLFLFNNQVEQVSGVIKKPYGKSYSLAQVLGMTHECRSEHFIIFRVHPLGLWFIRRCRELQDQGLFFHLSGYEYQLFTQFKVLIDGPERIYEAVWNELKGKGVPSIEQAILDHQLKPLYKILGQMFHMQNIERLGQCFMEKEKRLPEFLRNQKAVHQWLGRLAQRLKKPYKKSIGRRFIRNMSQARSSWKSLYHFHKQDIPGELLIREESAQLLALWIFIRTFSEISGNKESDLLDQWDILRQLNIRKGNTSPWVLPFNSSGLIKGFTAYQHWFKSKNTLKTLSKLFDEELFQQLCGVNYYDQILWFNKQGFEEITGWLFILARLPLQGFFLKRWIWGPKLWKTLTLWMEKYDQSEFRVQHMRTFHDHKNHG